MSAYLNTRVSLFASHLWSDADFAALLQASTEEIPQRLLAGGMEKLADLVRSNEKRSLEQSIIAQLLEETLVLLRPLSGLARAFLLYWSERFEVSNLKSLLRGKMTGVRPAALLERLTPMGVFKRLEVQDLAHAEDVTELLRRLETGHYASIVRQARQAYKEDPFLLDAALDRAYFEGLAQRARSLGSDAELRPLMNALIDRTNLAWLLRYRLNYQLPPAQVYYLLIACGYGLSRSHLQRLASLSSLESILAALPQELRLADATTIPEVHARLDRAASVQARRLLRTAAPGVIRAFAYLNLRERDLRGVRAILRGRHLHLSDTTIRQAIVQLAPG